jgi:hypothetical protein
MEKNFLLLTAILFFLFSNKSYQNTYDIYWKKNSTGSGLLFFLRGGGDMNKSYFVECSLLFPTKDQDEL